MNDPSKGYGGHSPQGPISNSNQSWTVYLLRCNDGTVYTGCTNDLIDRLRRHDNGYIHYTSSRLPVKLETSIVFSEKYKAFDFERYLKSGSGKAFMRKRLVSKL